MSQNLKEQISQFSSFKFDEETNMILNQNSLAHADVDQFLEIMFILDSNFVKYDMTRTYDLKILGRR